MLSEEENVNFVPESLRLLLGGLFVGKNVRMKTASIGQAVCKQPDLKFSWLHCRLDWGSKCTITLHHAS